MTKRGRKADPLTPPINGVSPHMSAIAVTDENSYVVYWSSQAEVLLGYASAEMIGKPVADLCASGGTLRHRDGRLLDAQVRLSPLLNAEGEAAFLLTMLRGSDARALADSALMGWIFDQQPVVLAICDREGRMLRGNKVMQQAIGKSEDAVRGLRPTEFLTGPAFEDAERLILRVSETGEPEIREYFVRSPGEDKAHAWAIDAFPLKDAAGRVHAVGYMANDYSQQYGSRERLALLSEARTRIGTSLDIVRTAHEFTEVAVPRFADFVSVDLLKPVFQGELPSPVHPGHDILHRAASSSGFEHPLIAALPGPGDVHTPMPSSPVAMCLANGKAALYDAEDPQIVRWLAEDPLRAALVDVFGARSLIAIPIRAQGTVLGAALFVRTASREAFSPDDLTVTEDLVARAAICLDNCRRFTRERGISLALQRSLLPQGPMSHPAVEAAVRYVPAGGSTEAGGDWFDVIPLPGARVGLVIGDVVGHGVNASATMGRLRTAVRTLADIDLPLTNSSPTWTTSSRTTRASGVRGTPPVRSPATSAPHACMPSTTRSPASAPWPGPATRPPYWSARTAPAPSSTSLPAPHWAWAVCPSRPPSSPCPRAACSPCSPMVSSALASKMSIKGCPNCDALWPSRLLRSMRWLTASCSGVPIRVPTTSLCSSPAPECSTGPR